jgi:uncharacterized membrane protein required for colicin V production
MEMVDMINWVDVVIAILLIYNLIRGLTLGFVRLVFGILGYIVGFFVSKEYYKLATDYMLANVYYFAELKETIAAKVEESFAGSVSPSDMSSAVTDGFKFPKLLGIDLEKAFNFNATPDFSSLASSISDFIIYGIGFVLVFLAVLFVIKIIGIILNSFAELPIIKEFNRLGGFIFGGIKGLLFVFLIMTIITFLTPIISDTGIMSSIQSSKYGIYFYNNNILLRFINIYLLN